MAVLKLASAGMLSDCVVRLFEYCFCLNLGYSL